MKKSILNLVGANELSRKEKKNLNGGLLIFRSCDQDGVCPEGQECYMYLNKPKCRNI